MRTAVLEYHDCESIPQAAMYVPIQCDCLPAEGPYSMRLLTGRGPYLILDQLELVNTCVAQLQSTISGQLELMQIHIALQEGLLPIHFL